MTSRSPACRSIRGPAQASPIGVVFGPGFAAFPLIGGAGVVIVSQGIRPVIASLTTLRIVTGFGLDGVRGRLSGESPVWCRDLLWRAIAANSRRWMGVHIGPVAGVLTVFFSR